MTTYEVAELLAPIARVHKVLEDQPDRGGIQIAKGLIEGMWRTFEQKYPVVHERLSSPRVELADPDAEELAEALEDLLQFGAHSGVSTNPSVCPV